VGSTDAHAITKYVGIFLKNTLLTIQQLNPNPRHLQLTDKKSLSEAWETEAVPAIHRSIDSAYGTNLGANYNPNNDGRVEQAIQNFFLDPLWLVPMGRLVEGVNLTLRGATVTIQEIRSAIKTAGVALESRGAMKPAFATAGNMMAKEAHVAVEASVRVTQLERGAKIAEVIQLEKRISKWLGEGTQFIRNKSGDPVFLSKDGLRKVRFDFNKPSPHQSPHLHLEHLVEGEWQEISRVYPIDVPHK
jgi:hypothetical protein